MSSLVTGFVAGGRLDCGYPSHASPVGARAQLREDVPLKETPADLEWQGAYERLKEVCHRLGDDKFAGRVARWRTS
jgi:hypothetical protein